MDADKRAAYDRFGHTAFAQVVGSGAGFHDPFDIFREVFRRAGGGIFETFFRRRWPARRSATWFRFAL